LLKHPAVGVAFVFVFGVLLRLEYLRQHPPENYIHSDMKLYVDLATRIGTSTAPLAPWEVTHPLGYPMLLSWLITGGGTYRGAGLFQVLVSSLIPLALGLLGWATFGRRTGLVAVVVGCFYFPFIEYGALFLAEVHFILWLTLAFAGFFGALEARGRVAPLVLSAAGGACLSVAIAMKSVALPGAVAFFGMHALALALGRPPARAPRPPWYGVFGPWLARAAVAGVAAAPLLAALARVCTRANGGKFCVTGNKVGADFLLGHYGPIADIEWVGDTGHGFRFGSPSSWLRHYEDHIRVPFSMTDNAANTAEAWRWIRAHPFDAIVLSLDHIYDTFFGVAMWPTYGLKNWEWAHLSQYFFVVALFLPTVLACVNIAGRGWRALATSRTALVLAPVLALTATVAIASGEIRYRIPFDIFFIAVACAVVTGDLGRRDGEPPC
jgi:hypothetical protein